MYEVNTQNMHCTITQAIFQNYYKLEISSSSNSDTETPRYILQPQNDFML